VHLAASVVSLLKRFQVGAQSIRRVSFSGRREKQIADELKAKNIEILKVDVTDQAASIRR